MGKGKYDFFDVDHTIIRGSSGPLFVVKGVRRGVFPVHTLAYIPFFFLQYYAGRLNADSRDWHFPVLSGRSRRELEEVSRANFQTMKNRIYPQVRTLIEQLQEQGRQVVLATSSLDLIVRPLAEDLGIQEVIATTLEFAGQRCTGRFVEGPLLREKKREKVYDFIRSRGVGWKNCSFYTDSVNDLALLESVADPVVVNPDRRLRRIASTRGWRILRIHR
ncbi:MAG: HAD-IB family hydrolase [Spirochaetaceae bacterium]|nr:MAG: HAD-IB family hydrolase [Spirochaetaceae bacterium]